MTWPGSITVGGSSLATQQRRSMCSPIVRLSIGSMSRTTSARSRATASTGRRRLNASSWRTSSAPRVGGLRELLEVAPLPLVGGRLEREVRVVEDHREQVVEVVRDAAGELADALEPAGLLELRLELLLARARHHGAEHVRHGLDEAHVGVARGRCARRWTTAMTPHQPSLRSMRAHTRAGGCSTVGPPGAAARRLPSRLRGRSCVGPAPDSARRSSSRPPGASSSTAHALGAAGSSATTCGGEAPSGPARPPCAIAPAGRGRPRRPAARPCGPARPRRRGGPRPAPRAAPP